MSRSIWKKLFLDYFLIKSSKSVKNIKKIWSRRSSIPASFIGKTILVHNGKDFKKISVKREHIGFKFGEFALTKKYTKKIVDKKK
jgi:small subunit ribosomal protein S19